jgi:hypothetical protein
MRVTLYPKTQTPLIPPRSLFICISGASTITFSYQNPNLVRSSWMLALRAFLLCMHVILSSTTFPTSCLSFPSSCMRTSHAFLPTVFPPCHAFSPKWACSQQAQFYVMGTLLCNYGFFTYEVVLKPYPTYSWILVASHLVQLAYFGSFHLSTSLCTFGVVLRPKHFYLFILFCFIFLRSFHSQIDEWVKF